MLNPNCRWQSSRASLLEAGFPTWFLRFHSTEIERQLPRFRSQTHSNEHEQPGIENVLHAENTRLNPLTLSSTGSPQAFVRSKAVQSRFLVGAVRARFIPGALSATRKLS